MKRKQTLYVLVGVLLFFLMLSSVDWVSSDTAKKQRAFESSVKQHIEKYGHDGKFKIKSDASDIESNKYEANVIFKDEKDVHYLYVRGKSGSIKQDSFTVQNGHRVGKVFDSEEYSEFKHIE